MVTSIGKFLRKLRIDNGEILKNMTDKLGVAPAFLSAVENGKKHMPFDWFQKIIDIYNLDINQQIEFSKAVSETEDRIFLSLDSVSIEHKQIAVSFAREFSSLSDNQIKKINQIINGGRNN